MRTIQSSRLIFATALVALVTLAGCPKGKGMPGGGGMPGGSSIPGGGNVPGGLGGESGMVDPNSCGNYAASDAGRKLKLFLQATAQLEKTTTDTVQVVKQSCIMMGNELGMTEADYKGETKDICAKVWGAYHDNFKVAFKTKAALKVKYKPAVCRINIDAQAKAAAECEGKASADIGATCSGVCNGKCDGTCAGKAGTGGSGGDCNGECKGTCHGTCEGHADVNASAQCRTNATVRASVDMDCTEPELEVSFDAKASLDKSKAEMVIKALKAGVPKLLSVKARMEPLKYAVEIWAKSANELKGSARTLATSFKDQAMCITGQIAAAASLIANIQVNVSVSVEVSAEASGSVGG
jgi:modification target Cys-rich repeat protein